MATPVPTISMVMVVSALMSGIMPILTLDQIRIGRVVLPGAGDKVRDHPIVERDGQGQKPPRDDRRRDDRQGDVAQDLPGPIAEVEGGFLDRDIGLDHPAVDDRGHEDHREGDMGERDRGDAAIGGPADPLRHQDEGRERGDAGDGLGHDERCCDEARERRAGVAAVGAGERDAGPWCRGWWQAWR